MKGLVRTTLARLGTGLVMMAGLFASAPASADHGAAPVLTIDADSAKALIDRGDRVERSTADRRSLVRAYQLLRGRRHTNVFVLEGDIDAWRGRGDALER